jgi:amino acid transporter
VAVTPSALAGRDDARGGHVQEPATKIVASIALTFFAFLGFGVMTFTVARLRDPERELPRAVALALGLTTAPTCRSRSASSER